MKKIFLCEDIDSDSYQLLKDNFIIINDMNDIDQCHGIFTRNLKIDKSFIDKCSNLEIIGLHGSGIDDVDLDYIKEKKIHFFNTPNLNSLSVAELIVSFVLTMSRNTYLIDRDFKQNKIDKVAPIEYLGNEISGKTFGLIGTGNIAIKAANILKYGFNMKIIAYSRSLTKEKADNLGFVYKDSIEDILKEADFINIGTSLNKDTYHMINSNLLKLISKHAYLINTARGAVVDENDLYEALKNHWFAGYACDVLENEPVSADYPLLNLKNVFYTPHIGGSTKECLNRVGNAVVEGFIAYFNGEDVKNMIC